MNKLFAFIFLLLFTGVFFSECKKYPEDDVFIQCRRPEKRLIKYGPWVFDKLTVDGVDKSAEFRADSAYFRQIRFYEPEIEFGTSLSIDRIAGYHSEYGVFEVVNNNKEIILNVSNSYINHSDYKNFGPLFVSGGTNCEILRLSKKGMTLKTFYHGLTYVLSLKSNE
jgi:hypothetical protein